MAEEELTLLHLSRGAGSFRLHLICEFGQLPEQVQAEYTPLTHTPGPQLKNRFIILNEAALNMPQEQHGFLSKLATRRNLSDHLLA